MKLYRLLALLLIATNSYSAEDYPKKDSVDLHASRPRPAGYEVGARQVVDDITKRILYTSYYLDFLDEHGEVIVSCCTHTTRLSKGDIIRRGEEQGLDMTGVIFSKRGESCA